MSAEKITTKLKKNDTVVILTGKDKGKTGKISGIDLEKARVVVEGINMVTKAVKKKTQQDQGGIIEIEASIHISNVAIIDSKGKPTRVNVKLEDGKKVRIAKTTGDKL